jgi:hypothetical protein
MGKSSCSIELCFNHIYLLFFFALYEGLECVCSENDSLTIDFVLSFFHTNVANHATTT